jgi:glucose-1-phosphate thymidylyltransferase
MNQVDIVGLVPMAGHATRLAPLPCSKELYPVTLQYREGGGRAKVVSEYLLERMRHAGIGRAFLVIRDGKWDIPAFYNDGTTLVGIDLAYVIARLPYGPPFSLDAAYPFVKDAIVAMGFPDILFWPEDAFSQLLARQAESNADLVLGLFQMPANRIDDTVEFDDRGQVRQVHVQQRVPNLTYTWNVAVWTPRFTQFMHEHLREHREAGQAPDKELIVGDILRAAVHAGLPVQAIPFPEGRSLDIGTPEGLSRLPSFLRAE